MTIELSTRAAKYLSTLPREDVPALEQLLTALAKEKCPVFPAWLAFHETFAGYVETIGAETATWGLIHIAPQWLVPEEVECRRDATGELRIVCADVHPSYDYWLDQAGQFVSLGGGGTFSSFRVKVERDALFWEVTSGRDWALSSSKPEAGPEALARKLDCTFVAEASDQYSSVWRAQDVLIVSEREQTLIFTPSHPGS